MNQGERELNYRVEIQCSPDKLNSQGFILDRHEIPAYFERKWGGKVDVLPSCEEMARLAAEELAKLTGEGAVRVLADVGGALAVWEKEVN